MPGKNFLNIFQHRVDGPRIDGWCWSHFGADGPLPPPELIVPLAPRLHLVVAVAEEEFALMACALTGGVGRVA